MINAASNSRWRFNAICQVTTGRSAFACFETGSRETTFRKIAAPHIAANAPQATGDVGGRDFFERGFA